MKTQVRLALIAAAAVAALTQTGCRSCDKPAAPPAAVPAPAPAVPAPSPAAAEPAPAATPEAASPTEAPPYPGPRSESLDGWRITTGFASEKDEPLTEPRALDKNIAYISVLAVDGTPVGRFDKLERGDMHAFLVARDLRHALYASAMGPLREGADARAVTFQPMAGGDHALIAVFQPVGSTPRVVTTPLSIKGALPEVMGPGVDSLGVRAKSAADHVQLSTEPAQPVVGQPVQIAAHDLDKAGAARGEVKLPFVVILNDQMGYGDVVPWDEAGKATWTPRSAGTWLVLAPPTQGTQALAFKLTVVARTGK